MVDLKKNKNQQPTHKRKEVILHPGLLEKVIFNTLQSTHNNAPW